MSTSHPHAISLQEAIDMTTLYRANRTSVLKTEYQSGDVLPVCETFDKEAFSSFMNNTACKAIRIYYGMKSNLQVHAIIVGVGADDTDMLPASSKTSSATENDDDDYEIIDDSRRCPPVCPPASDLNP